MHSTPGQSEMIQLNKATAGSRNTPLKVPVKPRKRRRETFTISFRVDEARLTALEQGASELGLSVHEYSRTLVCQTLDQSGGILELRDELEDVRREVRVLRDELLEGVVLLLTNVVEEERPGEVRRTTARALGRE